MTKVIRRWKQITFWNKIRGVIALFGAGGEVALIVTESHPDYKWIVGIATVIAFVIPYIFEDKNNDGTVDMFENPPRNP